MAKVVAISISTKKGVKKDNIPCVELIKDFGLKDDVHAGPGKRQVSLLAQESIQKMKEKGLKIGPGDFAENITTQGLELIQLNIGDRLKIGRNTLLEITQKGKDCQTPCHIFYQAGDCVMPREGVFAKVVQGGKIKVGDEITLLT